MLRRLLGECSEGCFKHSVGSALETLKGGCGPCLGRGQDGKEKEGKNPMGPSSDGQKKMIMSMPDRGSQKWAWGRLCQNSWGAGLESRFQSPPDTPEASGLATTKGSHWRPLIS